MMIMNFMVENPLHILLVEDDEGHIQLIRRAFDGRTGVRLIVARSLREARAHLDSGAPDLAIVDLLLPDGRGIDLLAATTTDGIPFPAVIMTSHGDEGIAVEAMKAGALDYLVKSEETFAQMPHFAARALREWHHIVERRAAEERLRDSNRELEAFAYTISHDLRSPLTPILGYAELLREEYGTQLDARAIDLLGEIEGQANRMLVFLEDLLELAQAGYLDRPAEPVAVGEVIDELVREIGGSAPTAVTVQEPLPAASVPRTLLRQVFQNLIGNALRYAGGAIEVGGRREGTHVAYFVRDHGPGIAADERERIFEVFYRGSTAGGARGTGIGLATVRKIARAYGGKAWVEETSGGGSTFWVRLEDSSPAPANAQGDQRKKFLLQVYGEYCELPGLGG